VNETEKIELLIEAAGLRVDDPDERAAIVAAYAPLRAGIAKLYADPDGRYEDHGLKFEADPPLSDWRG
jgi:ABC-type nitrate/sulfonate/bicarbonate transport system substrate-binding protein